MNGWSKWDKDKGEYVSFLKRASAPGYGVFGEKQEDVEITKEVLVSNLTRLVMLVYVAVLVGFGMWMLKIVHKGEEMLDPINNQKTKSSTSLLEGAPASPTEGAHKHVSHEYMKFAPLHALSYAAGGRMRLRDIDGEMDGGEN